MSEPGAEVISKRKHEFFLLWVHFGRFGRQDVHYHPCTHENDARCPILVADGRDCDGRRESHHEEVYRRGTWVESGNGVTKRQELTEDAPVELTT